MGKKISIIMPVFNCKEYVEESIKSVLNQEYKNLELIIVDDNSNDGTYELCKKILINTEAILLRNKRKGVSSARNLGIEHSSGDYLMFIDSDDIYRKDYVCNMVNAMDENVDWIVCNYGIILKGKVLNKKYKINDYSNERLISNLHNKELFNPVWNKLYKKEIIFEHNIRFNEKSSIAEDLEFNLDYFKKSKGLKYVNKTLYYYRKNNEGLNHLYKYDKEKTIIRKRLYEYEKMIFIEKNYNINFLFNLYLKLCFAELKQNIVSLEYIDEIIKDDERKKELKYIYKKGNISQKITAFLLSKKLFLKNISYIIKFVIR